MPFWRNLLCWRKEQKRGKKCHTREEEEVQGALSGDSKDKERSNARITALKKILYETKVERKRIKDSLDTLVKDMHRQAEHEPTMCGLCIIQQLNLARTEYGKSMTVNNESGTNGKIKGLHKMINDIKFGFRWKHATVEQIHRIVNTILEAYEKGNIAPLPS
jgi:hypothetical protein